MLLSLRATLLQSTSQIQGSNVQYQAPYIEVMYFRWCGYTVCGNNWAKITLRISLDKYPFFLIIIMKIVMFASVFIKYTWYLIYRSPCKYLQMVCPKTFLSLYRIRSLSLSLSLNYFKNICGLCNGKDWPPFALLAKLLTLPTILIFTRCSEDSKCLTLKPPERGILLAQ